MPNLSNLNVTDVAGQLNVDPAWLEDMVHRHGPELLLLIVRALTEGLTPDLIIEVVKWAGSVGLDILLNLFHINKLFSKSPESSLKGEVESKAVLRILKTYYGVPVVEEAWSDLLSE